MNRQQKRKHNKQVIKAVSRQSLIVDIQDACNILNDPIYKSPFLSKLKIEMGLPNGFNFGVKLLQQLKKKNLVSLRNTLVKAKYMATKQNG